MDNGVVREKELHIVNKPHYFGPEFHVKVLVGLGHDAAAGHPLHQLLDGLHGAHLVSFIGNGIDVVLFVTPLADHTVGFARTGGETSVIEADIPRWLSCASEQDGACQQHGYMQ